MKNKQIFLSILTVGLALGTAWAVRGQFGHEQGAAWAGGIGALCLILVSRRKDWYDKTFSIAMAAAFGWGISGAMSYGVVVGYGKASDFINVFYGLLMLFVLGVLYGFIGGGFFGLALMDSKTNRVKWHAIVTEMVAIGLLTYAILINQLGWYMTPPRSEVWAACLGAAIALGWHIIRYQYHSALKVAVWSALGAGFGFAFGNFLQVMGWVSEISFNFWNVMEYSIGFFGGIGMAYGTLTATWPVTEEKRQPHSNLIPILFVALFVPFVVWDQSFINDRFDFILENGGPATTVTYFKLLAFVAILFVGTFVLVRNYSSEVKRMGVSYSVVKEFFILYAAVYILLSLLITGVFVHPLEQYLYVLNLLAIVFLISRANGSFEVSANKPVIWLTVAIITVTVIALLSVIAMNSHDAMYGSHIRFGSK